MIPILQILPREMTYISNIIDFNTKNQYQSETDSEISNLFEVHDAVSISIRANKDVTTYKFMM